MQDVHCVLFQASSPRVSTGARALSRVYGPHGSGNNGCSMTFGYANEYLCIYVQWCSLHQAAGFHRLDPYINLVPVFTPLTASKCHSYVTCVSDEHMHVFVTRRVVFVTQIIMVRLQRVTFMALHNYLGLGSELITQASEGSGRNNHSSGPS